MTATKAKTTPVDTSLYVETAPEFEGVTANWVVKLRNYDGSKSLELHRFKYGEAAVMFHDAFMDLLCGDKRQKGSDG